MNDFVAKLRDISGRMLILKDTYIDLLKNFNFVNKQRENLFNKLIELMIKQPHLVIHYCMYLTI